MSRILVVEDNADLAFGLRASLEAEGHAVQVAEHGAAGLARVRVCTSAWCSHTSRSSCCRVATTPCRPSSASRRSNSL